jgi:hypothetical protein
MDWDKKNGTFEEIFLSHGEDLSGSSVAGVYHGILVVSAAVDEDHILICQ